jgi:hypothetical protein
MNTVSNTTRPTASNIAFYQDAKMMRSVGKAFMALGATLAVVSIGAAIAINPLLVTGIILATVAIGIGYLLNSRTYWNDPKEIEKISQASKDKSFDQLINQFGWEKTFNVLTIGKEKLQEKLLDKVVSENISYNQLEAMFGENNKKYGFYNEALLLEAAKRRLEKHPLKDTYLKEGSHNFTKYFGFDLDHVKTKFKEETKGLSLMEVVKNFGGWSIFDEIADPKTYSKEIETHFINGFYSVLKLYGVEIFKRDFFNYSLPHVKSQFINMMIQQKLQEIAPFSEIFKEKYGLVPEEWRPKLSELMTIYSEISWWDSDATKYAKKRFYVDNPPAFITVWTQFYVPSSSMSYGHYKSVPTSFPNPAHFPRQNYDREIVWDRTERRPARWSEEVDKPWKSFIESQRIAEISEAV